MARRFCVLFTALLLSAAVGIVLSGCRLIPRPTDTVPTELIGKPWVEPANPDTNYSHEVPFTIQTLAAAFEGNQLPQPPATLSRPLNVLALSAGGKYGAYSAGVMAGWTQSGNRPQFDVVTGVSAGVILAFYTFLGPQYDEKLHNFFTQTDDSDLYSYRYFRNIIRYGSVATPDGMEKILEREMSTAMLNEIRKAHCAGRRLFVATMNQRSKRLCVWDIGAIACSGRADADQLVRQVFLAAVAVPGLVPPVVFDIMVDGKRYQEVHADAGPATQAFMRLPNDPPVIAGTKWLQGSNLYVVSAGKLFADPADNRMTVVTRLAAAFSTALYSLYRAELFKLYTICETTGMTFNLVVLPSDFKGDPSSFRMDKAEMTRLYNVGFEQSKSGVPWRHYPPGIVTSDEALPRAGTPMISLPVPPQP